jgi:hypothetical protein
MIDYFVTDNNGLIIQSGSCHIESELPTGIVYQIKVDPNATHYINGEFVVKENIEQIRIDALQKRYSLLLTSDWTQLPDAPADKEAWANYRQHLRDITEQPDFPIKIDWGTPPSEV